MSIACTKGKNGSKEGSGSRRLYLCELAFGLPCSGESMAVAGVELRGDIASNADARGCCGGVGFGLREGGSRDS